MFSINLIKFFTKVYEYTKKAGWPMVVRRANSVLMIARILLMSKIATILRINFLLFESIPGLILVTIIAIIWISIEAHYCQKTPNSEAELAMAYLTATQKQKEQLIKLHKNLQEESKKIETGNITTQQISTYTINFLFYLTIIWSVIRTLFSVFAPHTIVPHYMFVIIILTSFAISASITHKNYCHERQQSSRLEKHLKTIIGKNQESQQLNFTSTQGEGKIIGIEHQNIFHLQVAKLNYLNTQYLPANYLTTIILITIFYLTLYSTPTAHAIFFNLIKPQALCATALFALILKLNKTNQIKSTYAWYFNSIIASIGCYAAIQWIMPFHSILGKPYLAGIMISAAICTLLCYWRNNHIGDLAEIIKPIISFAVGWSSAEMVFNTVFLLFGISIQQQFLIPGLLSIKLSIIITFALLNMWFDKEIKTSSKQYFAKPDGIGSLYEFESMEKANQAGFKKQPTNIMTPN